MTKENDKIIKIQLSKCLLALALYGDSNILNEMLTKLSYNRINATRFESNVIFLSNIIKNAIEGEKSYELIIFENFFRIFLPAFFSFFQVNIEKISLNKLAKDLCIAFTQVIKFKKIYKIEKRLMYIVLEYDFQEIIANNKLNATKIYTLKEKNKKIYIDKNFKKNIKGYTSIIKLKSNKTIDGYLKAINSINNSLSAKQINKYCPLCNPMGTKTSNKEHLCANCKDVFDIIDNKQEKKKLYDKLKYLNKKHENNIDVKKIIGQKFLKEIKDNVTINTDKKFEIEKLIKNHYFKA